MGLEATADGPAVAPEGQVWVCAACGRHNKNRYEVGDESCFLNAVLCYDRQPWEAVPHGAQNQ